MKKLIGFAQVVLCVFCACNAFAQIGTRNGGRVHPIIVGGGDHTIMNEAGTLWLWGKNDNGQLGNGTTTNASLAAPISNLTGVVAMAARNLHTLALESDGTVWAWGDNQYGQLGDGTTTDRTTAVQTSSLTSRLIPN